MRWTKGTPAAKAPHGVPLLVSFEWEGEPTTYHVARATAGQDRFCNPCIDWVFTLTGVRAEKAPARFWRLPT